MSQIKIGDLVQVVKPVPCCGSITPMYGHIFVVTGFERCGEGYCKICDARLPAWRGVLGGENRVWEERLKRIPPLEELEGQRTEETIRETA
jgi:hypothetical protein